MTKDECITLLKKYTGILKEKYGITSLSLFGSIAKDEKKEGSDIDFFVETEIPTPFLLMGMRRDSWKMQQVLLSTLFATIRT